MRTRISPSQPEAGGGEEVGWLPRGGWGLSSWNVGNAHGRDSLLAPEITKKLQGQTGVAGGSMPRRRRSASGKFRNSVRVTKARTLSIVPGPGGGGLANREQ